MDASSTPASAFTLPIGYITGVAKPINNLDEQILLNVCDSTEDLRVGQRGTWRSETRVAGSTSRATASREIVLMVALRRPFSQLLT